MSADPFVVAVVATFRRPVEVRRLLQSILENAPEIRALVVVDNGSTEELAKFVEGWERTGLYLNPGENLGCGGGLRLAAETAWLRFQEEMTHLLVLDDDAVLASGAVVRLLNGMQSANAEVGCAMTVTAEGVVGWLPGVKRSLARRIEKHPLPPERYIDLFGDAPVPFTWAQGICLLATRRVIESAGFHRDDFWVRGEDLEYSLRLTQHVRGVWVPGAVVVHIPPPSHTKSRTEAEYLKHCAMLQNVAYISVRLPHGRRILWTLPSNVLRFLRMWGATSVWDLLLALWRGAIGNSPAGRGTGRTFLSRSRRVC